MERSFMKPLVCGAVAGAIQRFYIGEDDINNNAMFATSVALGTYGSEYITPLVGMLPHVPTISESLYDGKTLAQRIVEVGATSGLGFLLAKYVIQSNVYSDELVQTVGVIAVSDFISEYVVDYLDNKPLDYLGGK